MRESASKLRGRQRKGVDMTVGWMGCGMRDVVVVAGRGAGRGGMVGGGRWVRGVDGRGGRWEVWIGLERWDSMVRKVEVEEMGFVVWWGEEGRFRCCKDYGICYCKRYV